VTVCSRVERVEQDVFGREDEGAHEIEGKVIHASQNSRRRHRHWCLGLLDMIDDRLRTPPTTLLAKVSSSSRHR